MQSYKIVQESNGSPRTNKVGRFVIQSQSGGDIGAPISTDRLPCGALTALASSHWPLAIYSLFHPLNPPSMVGTLTSTIKGLKILVIDSLITSEIIGHS